MIPLHVHSYYSLLEGIASPHQLVETAIRHELPALALTDHGRLSGAIEFLISCKSAGIQPVLGLELDVLLPSDLAGLTPSHPGRLVFLALDLAGWAGLCRLASAAQKDPGGMVALDFETLAENTEGLLCLTGATHSLLEELVMVPDRRPLDSLLGRLHELFPGRLYVQLHGQAKTGRVGSERLIAAAERNGLPSVVAPLVEYLFPDQENLQRTITAIRTNRPLAQLGDHDPSPPGSYFVSAAEVYDRFSSFPQALAASDEIASRCEVVLPLGTPRFPQIDLPPGMTSIQVLRSRAEQGADQLYGADPLVRERLKHELSVIEKLGYEALFLVMEEIVGFAHANGIPITSAARLPHPWLPIAWGLPHRTRSG